ncbi:Cholesterol side-chain cleavage enzyme [Durusdinium trenchii]|uniref:Mitochondrial (CYPXIA1) (Cholesterol desmolase) (Cytochrome P450 11A1) (Cytochrome P450(Scc)) n=1 Tax=Durusdinium trenchii TaxID=1381693 RepID=A0ABP0NFX5_9DINO
MLAATQVPDTGLKVPLRSPRLPVSRYGRHMQRTQRSASEMPPPGPMSVPILGSVSVLWALIRGKSLLQVLSDQRKKFGSLFLLKFGPSKQVWVSPEMLPQVYELPQCAGRPATFKDPFGDFLFLVRDPKDAKPLREKQKEWLEKNLDVVKIQQAAKSALAEHVWPTLDESTLQSFPEDQVRVATYSAVSTALLGKAELSEGELARLMTATREYSQMRVKGKFGKGEQGLPPGAAEIREIVEAAIARSGQKDVVLPLMVAASVGGAEIFPTLLHWILLVLAYKPAQQEAVAAAAKSGDTTALLRETYRALRSKAYSVALGPPRKVLADVVVDDMLIPEGALLFAMHPAIVDSALGKTSSEEEDFSKYAFGLGPRSCLGKPLAEAILPAIVGSILERYKLQPDNSSSLEDVEGEVKGQLIRPKGSPKLRWERRM